MTIFVTLVSILQAFSISLGVGSSTLAITNFFVAIADGKIDDTERRMMGVVYVVLRVAMVAILVTTLTLIGVAVMEVGFAALTPFIIALCVPLAVLYINAILMTAHVMPSNFGPSIQAGSWYTLGALMALKSLDMTDFTLPVFFLCYITWVMLATAIVNGIMAWIRGHKHGVVK